jgi:hypothetical protein
VDGEPHGDHRLQRAAQRREVDLGVEAAQDAGGSERANALQRGRGRDPRALGQLVVRDAGVLAERFEDLTRRGAVRSACRSSWHIATKDRRFCDETP